MSKDNKLLNITRWQECLIINHNTAGNPLASFASFSFGLLVAILGIGGWLPSFQNSQKEGSQDLYSFISRALSFILCHLYELRNAPIRPKSDKKSLHQPVVPNEATKSSNSLHQTWFTGTRPFWRPFSQSQTPTSSTMLGVPCQTPLGRLFHSEPILYPA